MNEADTKAYVSLKEHFESRIDALKEQLEARTQALQNELTKSESELRTRLEGMNEFRNALRDTQGLMATREKVDTHVDFLEQRIRVLEQGRAYLIGAAAAAATLVASVISVVARMLF